MTLPSFGFSFALSGRRMPPAVRSSASTRSTSTRSPRGRIIPVFFVVVMGLLVLVVMVGCGSWIRVGDSRKPSPPRVEAGDGVLETFAPCDLQGAADFAAQEGRDERLREDGHRPLADGLGSD